MAGESGYDIIADTANHLQAVGWPGFAHAVREQQARFIDTLRDLDAARARIKELEDTLRFYGTPVHYVHDDTGVSIIDQDRGARAHAALSAKGE